MLKLKEKKGEREREREREREKEKGVKEKEREKDKASKIVSICRPLPAFEAPMCLKPQWFVVVAAAASM